MKGLSPEPDVLVAGSALSDINRHAMSHRSEIAAANTRPAVSTAEKVSFLSACGADEAALKGPVEVCQTHMSWVFLGRERVLKLKKPVRYAFLDFSSLAARERNCREEVRLNRRLAPDVYLGVRPLLRLGTGALALGGDVVGKAEVVDWLVEMRRLPEEAMLDAVIGRGQVAHDRIQALGRRLAAFYQAAEAAGISPAERVRQLREQLAITRAILTSRDFMLNHGREARLLSVVEALLEELAPLLHERVAAGLLVDGHGDLRPEHVCLSDPPVIIDCVEFNRDLRLVDPYEEIAFLDLECRRLGVAWIGPLLADALAERLGHRPPSRLMAFYTAYKALIRARLSLAHLLEPEPREAVKWQPQACSYLDLTQAALGEVVAPAAR